jgi:hypothetical protein
LRELLVRFPGRIIALTDGTPTPAIIELASKYSIPCVQRDRLAMDLWPRLESMVYPQLGIRQITKVARLVLDTFFQPLPVGMRHLQPDTRQLVYEAESLTVDIAFERTPDSTRTTLLGQIMRTNEPQIPVNGVPIVLKSRKGPLGLKMTNETGEFSFEIQNERSVSLNIEVTPNDWILIILPPLDRVRRSEDQTAKGSARVDSLEIPERKLQAKKGT